jgi:hypothetical protein
MDDHRPRPPRRTCCALRPCYHTDHDTLDEVSRAGLEASVDIHMRLLEVTGALAWDSV